MIDFTLEMEDAEFLRELDELEMEVVQKLLHVFDQVGWETISFLRSLTGDVRPPVRPGEPFRRAHPGGWADVTSNLANAYRFELWAGGHKVRWSTEGPQPTLEGRIPRTLPRAAEIRLGFFNGMEYAAHLEIRDGYWVIREITEAGGPVVRAVREVITRIAPDAEFEG